MLILLYLEKYGFKIPDSFQNLTKDNYADYYKKNPINAKKIMIAFMDKYLMPVNINLIIPGDIGLMEYYKNNYPEFLSIISGNAKIICSEPNKGVLVTSIKEYNIKKAWRCLPQ